MVSNRYVATCIQYWGPVSFLHELCTATALSYLTPCCITQWWMMVVRRKWVRLSEQSAQSSLVLKMYFLIIPLLHSLCPFVLSGKTLWVNLERNQQVGMMRNWATFLITLSESNDVLVYLSQSLVWSCKIAIRRYLPPFNLSYLTAIFVTNHQTFKLPSFQVSKLSDILRSLCPT